MLSDYIADPKEQENHKEVIINPQLTKIIFDTNCYMNSLNSIKNIFEKTNLNIIIPFAVITELSGLQNCKKTSQGCFRLFKIYYQSIKSSCIIENCNYQRKYNL